MSAWGDVARHDFNTGQFVDDQYGDLHRYFWDLGDDVVIDSGRLLYTCSSNFEASVVQFENPQFFTGDFEAVTIHGVAVII